MSMTVRSSGALGAGGGADGGEGGTCEAVGASGRKPIRRDEERVQREAFERLKAELQHAFVASEESQRSLTAANVVAATWEE